MADRSLGQFVVYSLPAPTLPPASSDVATSPGGEACYQSIYLSMAPPQRSASPRARRTGDAAERGGSVDETGGGDHEHTDEESESESEDEDEDVDTTDTTDTESSSWTGGFSSYATATVSTDGESRYVALDEYIVDANGDEDQDAVRTALVEEMDEVELKRRLLFALSTLPARERSLVLQQLIPADGLPAHAKQEQDIRKREEKEKEKEKQREEVDIEAELREAFQAATQGKPVHDPEAEQKLRRDLRKLLVRRRSSGLKQKHLSYDRNWNEEYQSLVDKQGIWSISPTNAQVLSNLMHDFMFNVETYASVIINELNVDVSKKTIKPVDVGGVAGGQKFVVQGILFKFCKDPLVSAKPPVWLYGGDRPRDDFAMKAAGLELQGLGLLATPALMASICHPLMALIDYKGFRMVAVCLLPLAKTSLRYGSDDGGKTVVASDPVLNQIMDKVGQIYNLKKHTVGRDRVPLVGPGDIECHLGTDGRYYALDFARMMPPEAPSASNGPCSDRGVFFKMLRPELVRQFRVPLSSDAFTGWSRYDTDIEGSERDIREATRHLFEEVIPALARDLDQLDVADFLESVLTGTAEIRFLLIKLATRINTVHEMHRRGVNMRHIGKVRAHVRDACWSGVLLAEAVSRCIKHLIRHKMRKTVLRSHGVSSESACKDLVIEHVNIYFGNTPKKSDRFWKKKIKRVAKQRFPGLLTAKERKPTYDLRKSLSLRLVFLLTERWSVLRLTEGIKRELMTKDLHHVRILPGDVEEITASVRHSPVIHLIDASLYLEEAMNPQCDNDEALRLLGSANEHMTAAVKGKPRIAYILWSLGRVEAEAARRSRFDQDCEGQFEKAIVSHRQALEVEPRQGAYNSLASALDAFADKLEEFIGQEKKRWQSRRERREMRRSGQKVKRRAGADVAKPQWTEEQIREKEEKVRTLRLQAAEARGKAKELDSSANIFKFCANTLSGASEPVESFSD